VSEALDSLVVELKADVKGLQSSLQTATSDIPEIQQFLTAGNGWV
jgi:hypothetical protein